MSDIQPMNDRVVIKRVEEAKTTSAGFIIPDKAIETSDQGTVVSVGTGKLLKSGVVSPLTVKVGDLVLFGKSGIQNVKVNGEDLVVVREDDIIGILENDDGN